MFSRSCVFFFRFFHATYSICHQKLSSLACWAELDFTQKVSETHHCHFVLAVFVQLKIQGLTQENTSQIVSGLQKQLVFFQVVGISIWTKKNKSAIYGHFLFRTGCFSLAKVEDLWSFMVTLTAVRH